MPDAFRSRSTSQAVVSMVCGFGLILVGAVGGVTGQLRPLAGGGFALIGVGFAWSGLRWFRSRPRPGR